MRPREANDAGGTCKRRAADLDDDLTLGGLGFLHFLHQQSAGLAPLARNDRFHFAGSFMGKDGDSKPSPQGERLC